MATERVDIANMALTLLGEQDITSLEDDHVRARVMKIHYVPARDSTLEAHEWSFAIKRFVPGAVDSEPLFGPAYAFEMPSDIIRVLTVAGRSDSDNPIGSDEQVDWQFERNRILCNESVIYCRGIQRITEEGRFSPLFVEALAAQLAAMSAMALTASKEIQQSMLQIYGFYLDRAKSRDGLQGRSRRIRMRSMDQVR